MKTLILSIFLVAFNSSAIAFEDENYYDDLDPSSTEIEQPQEDLQDDNEQEAGKSPFLEDDQAEGFLPAPTSRDV